MLFLLIVFAIGALGIFRAAMFIGENGGSLSDFVNHFYIKLLTLKGEMHTSEALKIAESRHDYLINFLKQLRKELAFIEDVDQSGMFQRENKL